MFKQILQSIAVKILVAIINFLILIISSKYLGVSSRGEIAIFILNISIVQGINEIFTGYSIIHFVPKFNIKKIISTGLLFTAISSCLINLILVLAKKQLIGYEWFNYFISVLVILNTFNSMLLLGKQEIKWFNILAFLQPFLLFLGILISVFYFKIYTIESFLWPLFFSFSISFVLSSLVLINALRNKQKQTVQFDLKEILRNGFFYQSAILLFMFCNRYSYYLLLDKKQVGLYASACMLIESILLLVNSITPILISKIANQNSNINSANTALSFAKLTITTSSLILLVIILIPETAITFFLGRSFVGIKALMLVYSPGILLVSFFTIINNYFSGIGKQQFILLAYGFGFLVSLVIAPSLINQYNMFGAALTANLSYFTIFIVICFLFFRQVNIKWSEIFNVKMEIHFFKKLIKNEV